MHPWCMLRIIWPMRWRWAVPGSVSFHRWMKRPGQRSGWDRKCFLIVAAIDEQIEAVEETFLKPRPEESRE